MAIVSSSVLVSEINRLMATVADATETVMAADSPDKREERANKLAKIDAALAALDPNDVVMVGAISQLKIQRAHLTKSIDLSQVTELLVQASRFLLEVSPVIESLKTNPVVWGTNTTVLGGTGPDKPLQRAPRVPKTCAGCGQTAQNFGWVQPDKSRDEQFCRTCQAKGLHFMGR